MSPAPRKGYGLTTLRPSQPRVEPPPALLQEPRRLPGAFEIALDQIEPDPGQPRQDWSHDDGARRLEELAASLREFGVLQPLVVREEGALADGRPRYIVIAGARRRAAAQRAGLTTLPVVIRGEEGARLRVLQLIENLQRQALSPLDEARAYQELIDTEGLSATSLARQVHLSDQHVRSRLRLLADQAISDAVARRQLPVSAASILLQLPDETVISFKERITRGDRLHLADVVSVREQLRASGVLNPRFKGGGRAAAATRLAASPAPATDLALAEPAAAYDPAATRDPAERAALSDTLTATVALLLRDLKPATRHNLTAALQTLEQQAPASQWLPLFYTTLQQALGLSDQPSATTTPVTSSQP